MRFHKIDLRLGSSKTKNLRQKPYAKKISHNPACGSIGHNNFNPAQAPAVQKTACIESN
jgi:hypothetical protein